MAADALEVAPITRLVHVELGRRDLDDQTQLEGAVLRGQVFPVERRDDHRVAVVGRGVDHELFEEVALPGVDPRPPHGPSRAPPSRSFRPSCWPC